MFVVTSWKAQLFPINRTFYKQRNWKIPCRTNRQYRKLVLFQKNENAQSRPRYLHELPLVPIDEIDKKGFRWNHVGCYALYNAEHQLCYVGYTKNIQRKVAFHAKLQPTRCKFFKAFIVDKPNVSAVELERVLDAWLLEYGSIPIGNSTERHLWEGKKVTMNNARVHVAEQENRKRTTSSRVNDFFEGKDPFALRSKFSIPNKIDREDYLQTWIPLATVVGLSVLLWLMSLVTTSLQPDTLGL
eukprot:jgi/Galph1/4671/GphlegSOOS_G3359.1